MTRNVFRRWLRHALSAGPRRRRKPGLYLEPLEDRILLDAGLPPGLVVGRTLSSYFVGGVRNNQETITYTVYNEQANPLSGVLLTDTLQPGVTYASASALPDRSGQKLAWSLGTIQGFERASVTLTVNLANPTPLQLDTGAQAFAMLDAGAVTNSTPAAVLRPGNVSDPSLLASTPDANTTDPFIQEEAARLSYDPQQVFNFLHSDVGYNSYLGSLRGARGTLWSSAGNALDAASLGVALMRASGIPAQYAQGTLSQAQARQLIRSMFPASFQTVGYVPAGTQTADPANDLHLLSETESHYWFQFDAGSGMKDADPLMAGAAIGQTFTGSTGTFTEVADSLRQKTEVKLTAEIYSQAAAALGAGDGLSRTVVLDQTFNDVDLVGRPLSIGNLVSSRGGGFILTAVTNTYTPYIELGDEAFPDPSHNDVITGQTYQEVLTNFPLGNQVLTSLFLDVTPGGAGTASQSFSRALVDRIGYAARKGLTPPENLSIDPTGRPIVTPLDLTTLNILPGVQDPRAFAPLNREVGLLRQQFQSAVAAGSSAVAVGLLGPLLVAQAEANGVVFLHASDEVNEYNGEATLTRAYFDAPRVIIFSTRFRPATDPSRSVATFSIDEAIDRVRALPFPGQNVVSGNGFQGLRGLSENVIESSFFQAPPPGSGASSVVSTYSVFQAAGQQGIGAVLIDRQNLSDLSALSISPEAQARITAAVLGGLQVVVPTQMVMIDGVPNIAWYEVNPDTGEVVGVTKDGGHQGEYGVVLVAAVLIGAVIGITPLVGLFGALEADSAVDQYVACCHNGAPDGSDCVTTVVNSVRASKSSLTGLFRKAFVAGYKAEINMKSLPRGWGPIPAQIRGVDPPLAPVLAGLNTPVLEPSNGATGVVGATASQSAGAVAAGLPVESLAVSGQLTAAWTTQQLGTFRAGSLDAQAGTVMNSQGDVVGSGSVAFSSATPTVLSVSGSASDSVKGRGSLSFYGPAESSLGVSGNWDNYSATVTGNVSIALATDGLTLNGKALPAGTYTITTHSASLSGTGPSTSPIFSGSASVTATNGTVNLGPGSGNFTVGGKSLDVSSGATLVGYTGGITVTAGGGNNTDAVTLNGSTVNVLTISATPGSLTTDQNTPVTFQANVRTSFADTYNLTAQAPPGWVLTLDSKGAVTVTPAPGLQGGTYPIQVIAQSTTNPDLVAQTIVNVTVRPTLPGISFSIQPDAIYTVPFDGVQVPSAYQAMIHNNGPVADTFNLTFANIPPGFTLLNSGTSVTIPAGQTGILGLYLQPTAQVPQQGTQLSFTVTAKSQINAAITQTQTETFLAPALDAVTIAGNPTAVNTTPGAPVTDALTLTDAGNQSETVALTATTSSGLQVSGLGPVSLQPGQSKTVTISLTPAASTPLNSTLQATITATFGPSGSAQSQELQVPVLVVVPGARAIAGASVAAGQIGNTDLANRLTDLGTALTSLVQNPGSAVAQSQALADIDAVNTLLSADPFLAALIPGLATARGELAAATTAAAVQAAVRDLGTALGSVGTALADEVAHNFTLSLLTNNQVGHPQTPTPFQLFLQNTGTQTTTYDLSVSGLPAGVTGSFNQPSVTLAPGQPTTNVSVTLTSTSATALSPFSFTVRATAEGAPEISRTATGDFTARSELVQVISVNPSPAFTDPGGQVEVTARILNAVNQERPAQVSFTVTDASGKVLFTSQPVTTTLTVLTTLPTVDLGKLDTTGFALGEDTITVTVADASGRPIPGATGQGALLIGSPVTAGLSSTPATLPVGNGTVTTTLQVDSHQSSVGSLSVVSATPVPGAGGVAQNGHLLYVGASDGIRVYDVSNPAAPQLLRTVGQGAAVLRIHGNELITMQGANGSVLGVGSWVIAVYSLADPANPQLLGSSPPVPYYNLTQQMLVTDTHVFVPVLSVTFWLGSDSIFFQGGDLISVDISNPASPHMDGVLFNTHGTDNDGKDVVGGVDLSGGDFDMWSAVQVSPTTLLVASTTATGGDTQTGVGRINVVDVSDPTHMQIVGHLDIPGTVQATGIELLGNKALVTASTGGWKDFFIGGNDPNENYGLTGQVVLATLDVTDPRNPQLLHTQTLNRGSRGNPVHESRFAPLGDGLFAFADLGAVGEKPQLLAFNAVNPLNLGTGGTNVPSDVIDLAGSNNLVYTTSPDGLIIYQISVPPPDLITARVTVPTNNGVSIVPNSFNVAPTKITAGTGSETLEWDFPASALGTTALYVSTESLPGIQRYDLSTGQFTNVLRTPSGDFIDSLIFDGHGDLIYTLAVSGQVALYNPSTSANSILASGFNAPLDLALEPGGNSVLVSDRGNNRIERINLATGAVTTLAGNISAPQGISYDLSGHLFVVATGANTLVQLDPNAGAVLQSIPLNAGYADGLTFDPVSNAFWVADNSRNALIEVSNYLSSPHVQEFDSPLPRLGSGGFDGPESDGQGNIYIAEAYNRSPGRIDKYNIASNTFTALTAATTSIEDLAPVVGFGAAPGGTITFRSAVSNLQVGEVRNVTLGATVNFTSQGTPGTLTLPPTMVTGEQIIGLSPATRTVAPGAPAAYTVTLTNPTGSAVTYSLSVQGAPSKWVNLPASAMVPANGSVNVPLTLTSDSFAPAGDDGFTVTAGDAAGATASVRGDLILQGQPAPPDAAAHGIVVSLTPASASAGQGTSARYVVQLTNTGSADDTFNLSATGLPSGVAAVFGRTGIDVPPGASNFRDVTLTLMPALGTAVGTYPFRVTASSMTKTSVTASTPGTLKVVSQGVQVTLSPTTGAPGSTFHLTVKNTGTVKDTFDLSLGGPGVLVAKLAATKVTLAPGASTTVTITTTAIHFAVPGALPLVGIAKSEGNPAVAASATASIAVPASMGLSAQLSPGVKVIPVPGTSNFLVLVNNTGNSEDAYTATIRGTSGPVKGQLLGLDGQPTQTIPTFRLPGLSTGALLLKTDLAAFATGTVTVEIDSLTDPQIKTTVKATVSATPPPPPPPRPPRRGRAFG